MVTKKELLGLAIRVADKQLKVRELQQELEEMFAQYLGYGDVGEYMEKTKNEIWSDWFMDTIETGSMNITMDDIDKIIDELKK